MKYSARSSARVTKRTFIAPASGRGKLVEALRSRDTGLDSKNSMVKERKHALRCTGKMAYHVGVAA